MKHFYCANCGKELNEEDGAYVIHDNYLLAKFFDDNKSNRFCSKECAADFLFCDNVEFDELPLDSDEEEYEDVEE